MPASSALLSERSTKSALASPIYEPPKPITVTFMSVWPRCRFSIDGYVKRGLHVVIPSCLSTCHDHSLLGAGRVPLPQGKGGARANDKIVMLNAEARNASTIL